MVEEPQVPDIDEATGAVEALYRRMGYKQLPRVSMHDSYLDAFDTYLSMTNTHTQPLPVVPNETRESSTPATKITNMMFGAFNVFIERFESMVVSYPIRDDGKLKAYELEYVRRDLVDPGIERPLARYDSGSRIQAALMHAEFLGNPLSLRLDSVKEQSADGKQGWFRDNSIRVALINSLRLCAVMDFFMHHPFPYRPPNQEHAVINCLFTLVRNACLMFCYDTHVFLVRHPKHLRFDDQEQLHHEVGPAIEYVDGTGTYVWHGTMVPDEWIIQKDRPTAREAIQTGNIELRRAAFEIAGWDNIIQQLNYTIIETDPDEEIGTLIEVNAPDIGMNRERFLRVQCGTGRSFSLPVPPNINTALEANAWTYGIDPNMLRNLEVRT